MAYWRDPRSAIGLGYDLLRYMASVMFSSQAEYNEFSRFIKPLQQFRQTRLLISSLRLADDLILLRDKFLDFDFSPHPEPSEKVAALSDIGGEVTNLAHVWIMTCVGRHSVALVIMASQLWDDHNVINNAITLAWSQPWLNPHEVTEIVAIARWRDATGKRPIPRGDRWLAFQSMIDAREIDAAYIFATGAPLTP